MLHVIYEPFPRLSTMPLAEQQALEVVQDEWLPVETAHNRTAGSCVLLAARNAITGATGAPLLGHFSTVAKNLKETFDIIHGIEDTKVYKPDPKALEPMLAGLKKRGITYVGDSLNDFYAAQAAGVDFVGVIRGVTTENEFKEAGVNRTVASLYELHDRQ